MVIRFRRSKASDLERLQTLARDTIDNNYRSFIDDEGVDWFLSGPSDEYVTANIDNATIAIIDGNSVGFAVCKGNLIDLIMINHEAQRQGFGSALLAHCESELFERFDAIRLESFEGNGEANKFYRKNGWTRVGAVSDTMSGSRKWIFEKRHKY